MLKSFDRLSQRLRDPLLTVLTLMLSFLLFVLGPMQAARLVTGQHFGYFFGLVLVPAAFLYSRNLFVVGPIAVMTLSSRGLATVSVDGPSRLFTAKQQPRRFRSSADILLRAPL